VAGADSPERRTAGRIRGRHGNWCIVSPECPECSPRQAGSCRLRPDPLCLFCGRRLLKDAGNRAADGACGQLTRLWRVPLRTLVSEEPGRSGAAYLSERVVLWEFCRLCVARSKRQGQRMAGLGNRRQAVVRRSDAASCPAKTLRRASTKLRVEIPFSPELPLLWEELLWYYVGVPRRHHVKSKGWDRVSRVALSGGSFDGLTASEPTLAASPCLPTDPESCCGIPVRRRGASASVVGS